MIKRKLIFVVVFFLSLNCFSQWEKIDFSLNTYDVASYNNGDTAIAVGDNGEIWITFDGWNTFKKKDVYGFNFGYPNYRSVTFSREGKIIVGGSYDGIYVSSDFGLTWGQVYGKNTASVGFIDMLEVSKDTFLITSGSVLKKCKITEDEFASLSSTSVNANDLEAFSDSIIIGVGNSGKIMKSVNKGINWVYPTSGTTENLTRVKFLSRDTVIAMGQNEAVLMSTNSGDSWSTLHFQSSGGNNFVDFHLVDKNKMISLSIDAIGVSDDGGYNWTYQTFPSFTHDFRLITTGSNNSLHVFGQGIHLTSVDLGSNWEISSQQYPLGEVTVISSQDDSLVAYGAYASVMLSKDRGETWSEWLYHSSGIVQDIDIINNQTVYQVGKGTAGETVEVVTNSWGNIKEDVDRPNGLGTSQCLELEYLSKDTGFVSMSSHGLFKTTNYGNDWVKVSPYIFESIVFTSKQVGFGAISSNKILKTTDRGDNWVVMSNYGANDIDFINDSLGFISQSTRVLKTTDGGLTFQEIFSLPLASDIHISFMNEFVGYVVSDSYGLFITYNGGLSWKKEYGARHKGYGALESVHIDSKGKVYLGGGGTYGGYLYTSDTCYHNVNYTQGDTVCFGEVLNFSSNLSGVDWYIDGSNLYSGKNLSIGTLSPGSHEIYSYSSECSSFNKISVVIENDSFQIKLNNQIASIDTICVGEEAILKIDGLAIEYLWSTGETLNEIIVSEADVYYVTVSTSCGVSYLDSIELYHYPTIESSITNETGSFSAEVTALGASPFQYIWSNMETANIVSNLEIGLYHVSITDLFGCTAIDSVYIRNTPDNVSFQRIIGQTLADYSNTASTIQGGTIIGGGSKNHSGGNNFMMMSKLNELGGTVWAKAYGKSSKWSSAYALTQTSDGGIIAVGSAYGFVNTTSDIFVVKTDESGNIQWSKAVGGSKDDFGEGGVIETSDDGYLLTGYCKSYTATTNNDGYIVKLNSSGSLVWSKTLIGTNDNNYLNCAIETNDGGYAAIGTTWSNSTTYSDVLLVKLNSNGDTTFTRIYDYGNVEYGYSLQEFDNGDLLLVGYGLTDFDYTNLIAIRINQSGSVVWSKGYKFNNDAYAEGLSVTINENEDFYMVGWYEDYFDNSFAMKCDKNGTLIWSKGYLSDYSNYTYEVALKENNTLVLSGEIYNGTAYGWDALVIQIDSNGGAFCNTIDLELTAENFNLAINSGIGIGSAGTSTTISPVVYNLNLENEEVCTSYELEVGVATQNDCTTECDKSLGIIVNYGFPPFQYLWNNGETTQNISGLCAGTYTYTVTDGYNTNAIGEVAIRGGSLINNDSSICQGDSILLQGEYQNASGLYIDTLTSIFGCDSIIHTNLNVLNNSSSLLSLVVCEEYLWTDGNTYAESGTYSQLLTNAAGCDSVATLELVILESTASTTNISECESFMWADGSVYTESGTYSQTLTNSAGCDSITTLELVILESTTSTTNISECGSFIWTDGNTYTESGTYSQTLTNSAGCDSIAILELMILESTTSAANISECESYLWTDGNTYTESGTYSQTLTNAAGCDSVATLELVILESTASTTIISACESFIWTNGNTYTESGTYSQTLTNAAGCDSVATLELVILENTASTTNISVCENFAWTDGNTYTESGWYSQMLTNAEGCDSIANLELVILESTASATNISECESYLWTDGNTYTESGTYLQTLTNVAGCDSLVILELVILESTTSTTNISSCESYLWTDGNTYTESGTYSQMLTNAAGCDSVVTLELVILESTASTTNISECESYLWTDGNTYTESGTYSQILTNVEGCDSLVTLELVLGLDTSVTVNGSTLSTSVVADSYQWLDCADNFAAINGANSAVFVPDATGIYALLLEVNNCPDTSSCHFVYISSLGDRDNEMFIKVVPNPSDGRITLSSNKTITGAKIKIYNALGEVIFEEQNFSGNAIEIDFSSKASGVYFLQFIHEESGTFIRLVKN